MRSLWRTRVRWGGRCLECRIIVRWLLSASVLLVIGIPNYDDMVAAV